MKKHPDEEEANPEVQQEADYGARFEPEEDPSRLVEDEAGLGDIGAAQAKIKKLKEELEKVKKEKQEYLDGWQRAKADAINSKRESEARAARSGEILREELVHDIIPALDSFDMAAGSEAWAEVSDGWKSGMERVRDQLVEALRRHNIERYGKVGEMYSPHLHEVVQEVEDVAGESHEVVKIFRYGYKTGERVLRPAQVITKK